MIYFALGVDDIPRLNVATG